MKDLILYPPILGTVLASLLASFFIVYYLTRNRAIALIFKKSTEYIFLFIVSGVVIFPFSHLDIASIGSHEKGLFSAILLLFLYSSILFLMRVSIAQIMVNTITLFCPKYLGIYLGLIVASTFWSGTPSLTLRAAFSLIFISSFATHFARKYDWRQTFKLLRFSQAIIACFSTYMAIFVPSLGQIDKGWGGAIGHPIDLGNMMALTAALWLLNAIYNRKYKYRLISLGICIFSIVIMQLANSAGAFVIFLSLAVIVLIFPLFRKLNFLQANFLFTSILLIFSVPSIWLFSKFGNIMSLLGKDVTFTGRVPLWDLLIEQRILERPWLGYGYSGFWQPWRGSNNPADFIFRLIGDWAVHAHNGFLDIILNVGLIGFTVFALSFLVNVGRAIKLILTKRSPESILPLVILTYVFISNLSHSPIIMPGYVWFLYVLTTVKLQIDSSRKKRYWRITRVPRNFYSTNY